MSEPINTEDKEKKPQKPPSSIGRVVCEIVAGTATRFAIAVPVLYVTVYAVVCAIRGEAKDLSHRDLLVVGSIFLVVPMFFGYASSVFVCLVGSGGNRTVLFPAILRVGLRGLSVVALL